MDARGYSTRSSACQYSLGIPSYQITYPPATHPSAAPYANLSSHFRHLVRHGRLHRFLVKALLYAQYYLIDIDLSPVVYRSRTRGKGRRVRSSGSEKNSDEEEADETNSDESDGEGSCASSAFGFMEFKTNRMASCTTLTDYESMIDYGELSGKLGGHKTSVLINRDSDGSFVFAVPTSCSIVSRDSLPFHSNPVKLLVKDPSQESVVHTSTARLMIGQIKQQQSNVSQMSSFDGKLGDSHMACEDLSQLDAAKRFQNPLKKRLTTVEDRHSMPTLFVGNRFNRSDRTKVYIPAYKDRMNAQLKTITSSSEPHNYYDKDGDTDYEGSTITSTTHSSSIDLPAVYHPAPDQITAELLYNFPGSQSKSPSSKKDIIKPPSMFDTSHRISLSRELSPFKLHQLNSDKKILSKEPRLRSDTTDVTKSSRTQAINTSSYSKDPTKSITPSTPGSSIKRCVSHQFFKLRFDGQTQSPAVSCSSSIISEEFAKKTCHCCHSSQCPSPRSSDSGMAGSCTITSPDPQSTPTPSSLNQLSSSTTTPLHRPNPFSPFESEFLDHLHQHHQHQQRRGRLEGYRMDGDGTAAATEVKPRSGNGLRHSSSSHNLGRFDVVAFDDEESDLQSNDDTQNHDSGQFGETTSLLATDDASDVCDDRLSRPRMPNLFELSTSGETIKRDARCQSAERLLETDPHVDPRYVMQVHRRELENVPGVYRTGLYAHWWKKVQMPNAMVRDLIVQRSHRDRRSGVWGSGKMVFCDCVLCVCVVVGVRVIGHYV